MNDYIKKKRRYLCIIFVRLFVFLFVFIL